MKKSYTFLEDLDIVLERLGGSEDLLSSLLVKFRETYHETSALLLQYLSSSKLDDAYRLVHSIKGVAGNLGIAELYRNAIALENVMKSGNYQVDQSEMKAFIAVMDRVLCEMDKKKDDSAKN